MATLVSIYDFLREGGFLALFVGSLWVIFKLYTSKQREIKTLRDNYEKELRQTNNKVLEATQGFAEKMKEAQDDYTDRSIELIDRVVSALAEFNAHNRKQG